MGRRQDLRATLKTVFPSGVNIYDHPPDSMKAPCITIEGADPWIVPRSMAGSSRRMAMQYDLKIWVNRTVPAKAYNRLEEITLDLFAGLLNERWKAMEASAPVDEEHSNTTYATCNVAVTAMLEANQ